MLCSWIKEIIQVLFVIIIIFQTMGGSIGRWETKLFRFDTVMVYIVVLGARYLGGREECASPPQHLTPRSTPGGDQNTRIVIYVIMTNYM